MNLVTFDVDDTLVLSGGNDDASFVKAVAAVLGDNAFSPDWDSYTGVTEPAIAAEILEARLHRTPTLKELHEVESRYLCNLQESEKRSPGCFKCTEGARELVQHLRGNPDFAVAFATGGWQSCATFKLTAAGIDFEGLPLASANDSNSKPEIIRKAITRAKERWSVSAFDVHTHVGDRPSDYEAAAAIGCDFLAIAVSRQKVNAFKSLDISPIFNTLSDRQQLLNLFRKSPPQGVMP